MSVSDGRSLAAASPSAGVTDVTWRTPPPLLLLWVSQCWRVRDGKWSHHRTQCWVLGMQRHSGDAVIIPWRQLWSAEFKVIVTSGLNARDSHFRCFSTFWKLNFLMIFENQTFKEPSVSCPELAILFVCIFNRWISEPHVPALGTEWSGQSSPLSVFWNQRVGVLVAWKGQETLLPASYSLQWLWWRESVWTGLRDETGKGWLTVMPRAYKRELW